MQRDITEMFAETFPETQSLRWPNKILALNHPLMRFAGHRNTSLRTSGAHKQDTGCYSLSGGLSLLPGKEWFTKLDGIVRNQSLEWHLDPVHSSHQCGMCPSASNI